jgi:glycerol-3-phosphate dehydrogenase subunit C
MFSHYYPLLLGEEGEGLAGRTRELFEYLASVRPALKLPPSEPRLVALHQPCHQASRSAEDHVEKVLRQIPGLTLLGPISLCCGRAGSFGLKVEQRPVSDAIGQNLALALRETAAEAVVSSCAVCRLQIRQMGFQTLSPLRLLAEAGAETSG